MRRGIVLVDASQGVEVDFANAQLADAQGLDIIPVINKVDLPSGVDRVSQQIETFSIPAEDAIQASGKSGIGVEEISRRWFIACHRQMDRTPNQEPLSSTINSTHSRSDLLCTVFSGQFPKSGSLVLMSDSRKTQIKELGKFCPQPVPHDSLAEGEVGYVVTGIRDVAEIKIGDTLTLADSAAEEMLPGYKEVRPMVFSGLYPIDTSDYEKLKKRANFPTTRHHLPIRDTVALGFGFVVVSLGSSMEIVQEQLRGIRYRFDIDLSDVVYRVTDRRGILEVDNPLELPGVTEVLKIENPILPAPCLTTRSETSSVTEKEACSDTETIDETRVMMTAIFRSTKLVDFNDR